MGFKLAEAYVEIKGDLKGWYAALGVVRASIGGAMGAVGRLVGSAAGTLFAPLTAAAQLAGAAWRLSLVGGVAAVSAGLAHAAMAASRFNETSSKVGVVFGKSARIVGTMADNLAAKFGASRQDTMDAAAAIGLVGKASGMAQKEAAAFGAQFTKLALDASSFYDIPLEEALHKIRSGLVGEAEPMRALGVLLDEDSTKLEAYRINLAKTGAELTQQQKVMARASLITRGLADATGDIERTQDSFSNRLRELGGRFNNLAIQVGQYMLPALQKLSTVFVSVFQNIDRYLAENAGMFESWADKLVAAVRVVEAVILEWRLGWDVVAGAVTDKLLSIQETFLWFEKNATVIFERISKTIRDKLDEATEGSTLRQGLRALTAPLGQAFEDPEQIAHRKRIADAEFNRTHQLSRLEYTEKTGLASAMDRLHGAIQANTARAGEALRQRQAQDFGRTLEAAVNKIAGPLILGRPGNLAALGNPAGGLSKAAMGRAGDLVSGTELNSLLTKGALGTKEDLEKKQLEEAKAQNKTLTKIESILAAPKPSGDLIGRFG